MLLNYVADADLHTKHSSIDYSTNVREIVTVEYMIEISTIEFCRRWYRLNRRSKISFSK